MIRAYRPDRARNTTQRMATLCVVGGAEAVPALHVVIVRSKESHAHDDAQRDRAARDQRTVFHLPIRVSVCHNVR
jgi:hypothetical protein